MTGTVGMLFGMIVIVITVVLLVKQFDTKTVLLSAGFIMAIAAFSPLQAFNAFSTNMVAGTLIQNICTTLGFAAVLKITGCDKHLIYVMAGALSKVRPLLIPGAMLATFVVNISLPSAAGVSAAMGVILIPLLISQGVHPIMAATAIIGGTTGATLNPGAVHYAIISNLSGLPVIELVSVVAPAVFAGLTINMILVTIIAIVFKENRGYVSEESMASAGTQTEVFRINPLYAILPMVPVIILIVTSFNTIKTALPWTASILVPHVMLFGAFLCIVATRTSLTSAVKDFFNGMGKGYADIIGIIISAGVFVSGMRALGIVDAFLDVLRETQNLAGIAATFGPFLLGIISGSGDAAALAFNEAVTPHAENLGYKIPNIGTLVMLTGSMGRLMSPLAGATIICAGIAKVNPFDIAKRNAPGMLICTIVSMMILL